MTHRPLMNHDEQTQLNWIRYKSNKNWNPNSEYFSEVQREKMSHWFHRNKLKSTIDQKFDGKGKYIVSKNKSILNKRLSGQRLSYFSIIFYWADQKLSYCLAFWLYTREIHWFWHFIFPTSYRPGLVFRFTRTNFKKSKVCEIWPIIGVFPLY